MRLLAGFAAVLVLAFATACGGDSPPPATQAGGGPAASVSGPAATPAGGGGGAAGTCTPQATSGATVISMDGTYSVKPADVTISAGGTVTFTNNSSTNHHIKFAPGPDCGFTLIGKSASVQFDAAGQYSYVCTIQPNLMHGIVTVQ